MGTTRLAVDPSLRPLLSRIDRRQFLGAMGVGLGGLGLSGCIQGPIPLPGNIPGPIIDAHCHVFNASDLPVAGFLEAVTIFIQTSATMNYKAGRYAISVTN